MPASTATTLLAALVSLAAPSPGKQTWESAVKPDATAEFLPHSAVLEVDGKPQGHDFFRLAVSDPKRTFRLRLSAEGFETKEAVVEAAQIVNRHYVLALRPAGYGRSVDPEDAPSMALAASALLRAGRAGDAADYAEQSLQTGTTPLANRVLGDVWKERGDREKATKYYTMYLSLSENPADGPAVRAWLMQDKPGDITIPAK